jgi:hypothetical protein
MVTVTLFRIGLFLTGLLIAGEAFALLVGMYFLSERGNPWISFKNGFLLVMDLITGAGLIYLASTDEIISSPKSIGIALILILAILAHGYREWEYLAGTTNKFCANIPLFVLNNVKLISLSVISIAAVLSK